MTYIMKDTLEIIGYESPRDNNMTKTARLLILNWACFGHMRCIRKANEKLMAHLNDIRDISVIILI